MLEATTQAPASPLLSRQLQQADIEPDKAWKDNLYKTIEETLQSMEDDAKTDYDESLAAAGIEEARESAQEEYHQSMDNDHMWAVQRANQVEQEQIMATSEKTSLGTTGTATTNLSSTIFDKLPTSHEILPRDGTTTSATPPGVSQEHSDDNPRRGLGRRNFNPYRRKPNSSPLRRRSAWTEAHNLTIFPAESSMLPSPSTLEAPLRPSSPGLNISPISLVPKDLPPELAARSDQHSSLSRRGSVAASQEPINELAARAERYHSLSRQGSISARHAREGYPLLSIPLLSSLEIEQPPRPLLLPSDSDYDYFPADSEDELLSPLSRPRRPSGSDASLSRPVELPRAWRTRRTQANPQMWKRPEETVPPRIALARSGSSTSIRSTSSGNFQSDIAVSRPSSSQSFYSPKLTSLGQEVIGPRPVPPARPASIHKLSYQTNDRDPYQSQRLRNERSFDSQALPNPYISTHSSPRLGTDIHEYPRPRDHYSPYTTPPPSDSPYTGEQGINAWRNATQSESPRSRRSSVNSRYTSMYPPSREEGSPLVYERNRDRDLEYPSVSYGKYSSHQLSGIPIHQRSASFNEGISSNRRATLAGWEEPVSRPRLSLLNFSPSREYDTYDRDDIWRRDDRGYDSDSLRGSSNRSYRRYSSGMTYSKSRDSYEPGLRSLSSSYRSERYPWFGGREYWLPFDGEEEEDDYLDNPYSQEYPGSTKYTRDYHQVRRINFQAEAAAARIDVFEDIRSRHGKTRYLVDPTNLPGDDADDERSHIVTFISRENVLAKQSRGALEQENQYRREEEERRRAEEIQLRAIELAEQMDRVREEARQLEEQERRKQEEEMRQREEFETRKREEEQKKREEERKKQEEERKRIDEEERQRRDEAKRKEEELRQKEAEARRKEEEIRRREKEIKAREEELQRRELEMIARRNQLDQPVKLHEHEEGIRHRKGGMGDFFHKSRHTTFPDANISISEQVTVLKNPFPLPGASEDDILLSPLNTIILNEDDETPSDIIQATGWFRMVFCDRDRYQRLLNLRGISAQSLVDILQELLDSQHLAENRLRKKIIVTLQQMATREGAEVFPSSCEVKDGIVPDPEHYMGSGGFGDIYKCLSGGRMVCVKVIRLSWVSLGDKFVKQFIKEGILWAQLSHQNVLPFQGFLRYQQRPCLLSPWMNNGHVVEFLKNNPSFNRYLLVRDITNGLNYLHSWGIVHGDLKGGNVLVDDCGHACLSDFGISSVFDATLPHWTSQSTVASKGGSVRWQAPELLNGDDDSSINNTVATDIYAWACVCYEIFTQRLPLYEVAREATITLRVAYQGLRPSRPSEGSLPWCAWGLQQTFWELMENCWTTEPEKRPSVEKLLAAPPLVEALDERANEAQPEPTSQYRTSKRFHTPLPTIEDLERLFMSDADQLSQG